MGLFMAIEHRSLMEQIGRWGRWHFCSNRRKRNSKEPTRNLNRKFSEEIIHESIETIGELGR